MQHGANEPRGRVSSDDAALDAEIDRLTFGAAQLEQAPLRALDRPRFAQVVVAVDPAEEAGAPAAWARWFRDRFGSEITLVAVTPTLPYFTYVSGIGGAGLPAPSPADEMHRSAQREAQTRLREVRERVAPQGEGVRTLAREGQPGEELVRVAEEVGADLVIVGAVAPAVERVFLGSVADHVKDHAPCSVLLAKAPPSAGDVLVAVDGSSLSRLAARVALDLAREGSARLRLLHVFGRHWRNEYEEATIEELRARQQAGATSSLLGDVQPVARVGDPREGIVQEARDSRASLIVLGTRGLSGLRRLFTGSVSRRVAHASGAPVLLVRARKEA